MDIVVWAQEAIFIHICIIVVILDCLGQVSRRCFTWVELPYKGDSARFSEVASGNPTSTCIPRVDG